MKEPHSKLTLEQLEQNFADINPPLSPGQALEEGSRCLFCHDAPCIKACPTGIDVPQLRQVENAKSLSAVRRKSLASCSVMIAPSQPCD